MECIICLDSNNTSDNNLQSLHCQNCGDKNKWIHKKCFDKFLDFSKNNDNCPLCRSQLDMSIKIKKFEVNSKNNKNDKNFTIINISRDTTNIYLDNELNNEIIIKKSNCNCIKDFIFLEDKYFYFIFFSVSFIVICGILTIIFCAKKSEKICYNCMIVSTILSFLLSILFINFYRKMSEENKIKSKLGWVLWFILTFGFTTLLSFDKEDDCAQEYVYYFGLVLMGFICGFCCKKYNEKIY